jgi:Cys-rich protein (TIGR01571 family)
MADNQWSRGRRAGFFLGGCLAALVPILLSVEAVFHAGDLVHAAQEITGVDVIHTLPRTPFAFHEQRRLQEDDPDADSSEGDPRGALTGFLIHVVTVVVVLVVDLIALYVYYSKYIKPTFTSYLRPDTVVPQDLQGKWMFGLCDWSGDMGTCCCFTFFPACTFADLWYRAGMIHAFAGDGSASVDGWQWFVGILGWSLLVESGFEPCLFAVIRGGVGWITKDEQIGGAIPMRKRFNIPHNGFSTFIEDCCVACWCYPCMGTQEFRQVQAVLDRDPQGGSGKGVPGAETVGVPVSTK